MRFDRTMQVGAQWLTILTPLLMLAGPAPFDVSASLVAVLFLLHAAVTRDGACLRERWMQIALVLWFAMCLRNSFTGEISNVIRSAVWIRYPLFAAALAYWVLRDETTQRRTWGALFAAILFLIADSFWQYATGTDITGREVQHLYGGAIRLTGPFSNPRVGVTIVWLLFPLLLPLLQRRPLHGMALAVAAGLAVYLSGERTALMLFLVGIGLSFLLVRSARRAWGVVVLAVLAIGGVLSWKDSTLISRQFQVTWTEVQAFSESTYGKTWGAAYHIWRDHPLVGVGSKNFQSTCKQPAYGPTDEQSLTQRCPMHAHNIYLEWLVEYGLLGGLLVAAWMLAIMRDAWRGMTPVALGLTVTLLLRFWPISVTPSQFVAWSAIPFWMVLGWWYALRPKP